MRRARASQRRARASQRRARASHKQTPLHPPLIPCNAPSIGPFFAVRSGPPPPFSMPFLKKTILALTCSVGSLGGAGLARAEVPSFSKHIRPLLSDTCLKCHGPDDKGRKGDLRLDLPESAHQGGKSGVPAIVPGKVSESEIIKRLRSTDPDEVMPPPAMKRVMKPEEIKLFEDWVAAGAKYEKHWAFDAPVLPPVPAPVNAAWPARNEIDAFVQPALAAEGFAPAPEAAPATLFRRASLDLTGLPPTPAEWAAQVAMYEVAPWEAGELAT